MSITQLEQFNKDSRDRMPIWYLWRAVWRFIFDEYSCGVNHQMEMQSEILKWKAVVDYQKKIRIEKYGAEAGFSLECGKNGNIIDEIEYNIMAMSNFLVKNEFGGFDRTKDLLRIHKIDYKRYVLCKDFFPECADKDGEKKGQEALKANMAEFPELYPKQGKNRIEGIR